MNANVHENEGKKKKAVMWLLLYYEAVNSQHILESFAIITYLLFICYPLRFPTLLPPYLTLLEPHRHC